MDGSLPNVCPCTVPWENLELTGPESACLVADAAVGGPMVNSTLPPDHLGPNPDLTLRFTTAPASRVIDAAGTILSVQHGTPRSASRSKPATTSSPTDSPPPCYSRPDSGPWVLVAERLAAHRALRRRRPESMRRRISSRRVTGVAPSSMARSR